MRDSPEPGIPKGARLPPSPHARLSDRRAPNGVDTLSPDNRFAKEVNKLPIASGIPYHPVMGDRGKGEEWFHGGEGMER